MAPPSTYFTERLINEVRKHEVLYNPKHPLARIHRIRGSAWGEIEKVMNENASSLRKKWRNIKDCYVKHLKSFDPKYVAAKRSYRNWQWAQHMAFYKPFVTELKDEEINKSEGRTHTDKDVDAEDFDSNVDTNESPPSLEDIECDQSVVKLEFEEGEFFPPNQIETEAVKGRERRKRRLKQSSVDDFLEEKRPFDALDLIFLGYARTIKSFSPTKRAVVKMKIAQLIMEEEIGHITNTKNATTTTADLLIDSNSSRRNVSKKPPY